MKRFTLEQRLQRPRNAPNCPRFCNRSRAKNALETLQSIEKGRRGALVNGAGNLSFQVQANG